MIIFFSFLNNIYIHKKKICQIKNSFALNQSIFSRFFNFVATKELFEFSFGFFGTVSMGKESSVKDLVSLYTKSSCLSVKTTGDGRCLFHSISICLVGNELYTHIIKLACVFVMLKNESYIKNVLSQQNPDLSFETLIENTANNDIGYLLAVFPYQFL